MVAVEVNSSSYFWAEQVMSVTYIHRTGKKSTSRAREAWSVQWLLVLGNVITAETYVLGLWDVDSFARAGTLL